MITLVQSPGSNIMPVYNTIAFTVDSDNKTQCSFKYLCDIYVNGVYVTRLKGFPLGTTGYCTFKVERVLQDYLSYDLHHNLFGSSLFSSSNPNSIIDFVLQFGEEYDGSAQCDTGTTIYSNVLQSSAFRAFNGVLQRKEWLTWNSSSFVSSNSAARFLTNMPNQAKINIGEQLTYNIFTATNTIYFLEVVTYNSAGGVLGTYRYANPTPTISQPYNRITTVGVGPENLNNSTLSVGSQPVITDAVAYYTFRLINNSNVVKSETRRLDIDTRYMKWDPHRVWFLNRLGGFDAYTFPAKGDKEINTSRTEFTKIYGDFRTGSPSNLWSYDIYQRGRTTLSVNAQQSETWRSNWLSETEAKWMEELFTTVELYESKINQVFCISNYEVDPYSGGGIVVIGIGGGNTIPGAQPFQEGDTIFINTDEDSLLYGEQTVLAAGEGSVTIGSPFGPLVSPGNYPLSGTLTGVSPQGDLDPLILKSARYEEKKKKSVKNIEYTIEVDRAYAINTQRN
jgi:hypothetical protein